MINLDAALDFTWFVQERHRIWEQRQAGEPAPWTADATLRTKKFTNIFRVLDPGSQFIFDLEAPTPWDTLARIFLYRHTGRLEVWEHVNLMCGYPTTETLDDALEAMKSYRGEGVTKLKAARRPDSVGRGNGFQSTSYERPVFTSAYLVFPQSGVRGTDKLQSIFDLTKRLFVEGETAEEFLAAKTQLERFNVLKSNKGVADFMAMQILTDWGYTTHCGEDREDQFVVLGPGALRGAKILDPDGKPMDTLMWAVEAVRSNPACPKLVLPDGRERKPSLMDVQNLACEYSKYARYQGQPVSSKPYHPAHPGKQPRPKLPEFW